MQATFNRPGFKIFDNYVYTILGDGCLQEGVQAEAISLAGHLKLGNLICLYDDNHISIDGDTALGFTEDVCKRFEASGWHTIVVSDGNHDLKAIEAAIANAKLVTDKPSLIKIFTTIGYGSLSQGEEKVHGAPLGDKDIEQVKSKFGFNPEKNFFVPDEVYNFWKDIVAKNTKEYSDWKVMFEAYSLEHPGLVY